VAAISVRTGTTLARVALFAAAAVVALVAAVGGSARGPSEHVEASVAGREGGAPARAPVARAARRRANLWVDTSGGSCSRRPKRSAYSPATACGSLDAAYRAAALGDTVIVTCSTGASCTYPAQTIREHNAKAGTARARHVLIKPDPSKRVTIYGIASGTGGGGSGNDGADHITFKNFVMHNDGRHDCTFALRPDSYDVTLDHVSVCSFYMNVVHDVTVQHSTFGPCWAGSGVCTNSRMEGGDTNVKILNNTFHDYLRSNDGQHFECMVAWGDANGLVIAGNKFVRCAVFDVFLSNQSVFRNVLVQNNWFDLPTDIGTNYVARGQVALGIRNDNCFENITVRNNSFTKDTQVGWPIDQGCWPFKNAKEIGDVAGSFDCGSGVTSRYNVGPRACRGNGNVNTSLGRVYKVDNYLGHGGNLHLRSTRTAAAGRVPRAFCAAFDIDGRRRTGRACDAGSDER
jgi:hypothetical protein